jgi:hypothetical protein
MPEVILVLGAANKHHRLLRQTECTDLIGHPTIVHLGASNTIPATMAKLIEEARATYGDDIIAYVLPPKMEGRHTEDTFRRDMWHRATSELLPGRIKELEIFQCERQSAGTYRFYIGGLHQFD